jgi:hypothetical protein
MGPIHMVMDIGLSCSRQKKTTGQVCEAHKKAGRRSVGGGEKIDS